MIDENTIATANGWAGDAASLLTELAAFVRRFVVVTEAQSTAIVLWIIHTHAFDAAESTPYIWITSAEKGSGKSRLLEVLVLLVARPWYTARTSVAALIRKVDAEKATLLLDESDAAFGGDKEYAEGLRGILNSGHRRGGKATLCVGQGASLTTKDFDTFSPKAIGGIGKLPDTIAHRSIRIEMKRKAPGEAVHRFRRRDVDVNAVEQSRRRAQEWAEAHIDELELARPELPESLDDRAADGWEPLLAIADLAGCDWPQRARDAAVELSTGDARDDDSIGIQLLADCSRILDGLGEADRMSTAALIEKLVADEEAPWGDYRAGKPISPRALSVVLRRFGIRPRTIRLDDGTAKGYMREAFEDARARYLPSYPLQPLQPSVHTGLRPDFDPLQGPSVTDAKEAANPYEQRDVTDVTDKRPFLEHESDDNAEIAALFCVSERDLDAELDRLRQKLGTS